MFDRTIMRLLLSVALVFLARTVHASTIDFMFSGTGSGNLDGQPFTAAAFSIESTADTIQISNSSILPVRSAMVTVPGLGLGTFTDPIDVFDNPHAGYGVAGMIDLNVRDILDIENPVFFSYGLNTSLGPISGASDPANGDPSGYIINSGSGFPTTAGVFTLTSVTSASFQATIVPEPATLTLLGTALLGLGVVYLRRRRAKTILRLLFAAALLASAASARADVFNMGGTISGGTWTGLASLSFVTVGDPGNLPDPATGNAYGSVGYTYQMGKYDVTIAQYVAFLNAVATTSDPYGLYQPDMAKATIAITRSGSPGSYSYVVTGSDSQGVNCPIFGVSWGDAARFCNWLDNGQPTSGTEATGTTETGAYALNGAISYAALMAVPSPSHSGPGAATYFIPSENEWYKVAYYDGSNSTYWLYPTQSNTAPGNTLPDTGNNADYYNNGDTDPTNLLTPVGSFALSPGPYGTYDMGGDVWQWDETAISGSFRGVRGGSWYSPSEYLASSSRIYDSPVQELDIAYGIRVAASVAVPEPASIALLLAGAVALGIWRLRRKA